MDFLMSVEINIQILLLLAVRTPRTVKPSKKKLEADQDNEVFFTLRKKPHKVSIQCHEAVNLVLTQHVKWCEQNIFKNMCSTVVISVLCGCCTRLLFPMFVCSSWSAWKCQCCSAGSWLNIKMLSYQDRKSHCGDKTVVRSSYLHNGISYTGKTASLYWISPLVVTHHVLSLHHVQQPYEKRLWKRFKLSCLLFFFFLVLLLTYWAPGVICRWWLLASLSSRNGFLPACKKPLPELMFTNHFSWLRPCDNFTFSKSPQKPIVNSLRPNDIYVSMN